MGVLAVKQKVRSLADTLRLMYGHWRSSEKTRKHTQVVYDNTGNIGKREIVLILVIKDEADRVPYFLDYYRKLGIGHFIVLDNESVDDLHEILANQADISLFRITQAYSESRYGIHWINYFAREYCIGHWVLSVDSDEFLVYPHIDTRDIRKLCQHLDDLERRVFFAPMMDMYSDRPVADTVYRRGEDPLALCPFFDGNGYFSVLGGLGDTYIRGGVRMRVFQKDSPESSPALNKYPLIKWDRRMFYHSGAHVVLPKRRNKIASDPRQVSGALLHFKFFSDLYTKAEYAVKHGNHYNNSAEYRNYLEQLNILSEPLGYEGTIRYQGIQTLIDKGFVRSGDWK